MTKLSNKFHQGALTIIIFESLYPPGKLPTYPSLKPTSTLTSHLGHNVGLGEGQEGSFPETVQ